MKPPDPPETNSALAHFAEGDTSQGNELKGRILACLRDRLPDLPGIHITVFGNTAVLRGEVRSLPEKRLCVECCRHVPGVVRVMDDMTIADHKPIYLDPDGKLS